MADDKPARGYKDLALRALKLLDLTDLSDQCSEAAIVQRHPMIGQKEHAHHERDERNA